MQSLSIHLVNWLLLPAGLSSITEASVRVQIGSGLRLPVTPAHQAGPGPPRCQRPSATAAGCTEPEFPFQTVQGLSVLGEELLISAASFCLQRSFSLAEGAAVFCGKLSDGLYLKRFFFTAAITGGSVCGPQSLSCPFGNCRILGYAVSAEHPLWHWRADSVGSVPIKLVLIGNSDKIQEVK